MSELTIEEMINDVIRKSRWVEDRLPLQRSRSALLSRIASIQKEADDSKSKVKPIHFKTSEQERFIWWIHQVYARNVQDLIAEILEACTYQDEATAASGKYGLPIKCFEHMERLRKYSHGIYDGTYLDVEISADVKTSSDNNKLDNDSLEYAAKWIENSLVGETNERVIEFGKNMAMSIRAAMSSTGNEVCPDCGGSGELAGDYFSSDGMFSCGRCNGTGAIWANTIT